MGQKLHMDLLELNSMPPRKLMRLIRIRTQLKHINFTSENNVIIFNYIQRIWYIYIYFLNVYQNHFLLYEAI